MAKNPITVLQEGKAAIDELNAKLIATNNNILNISESAREAGKAGLFNAKVPNDVNASLQKNKTYIEQVNVAKKEQERLERALIVQIERNRQVTSATNQALIKARFETQEQNKAIKEAAILSSKLASEYQKLQVRYNQTAATVQSLNAKRLQGQKLSKQEQAQLKKSTADFQKYQKAILGADASIGRFNRNVGNYPKALNAAASAARNFAGAMGLVGGAFLVVRVISDAFKRLREFDKEMQNMAGILRTTRPELKELEDRIIKVAGASIKTSNEVAKLATSLLTLGKTKDEVLQLIEPVNDLSIALGATSDEAGEFLIQTLNAFDKGADSAEEFADTIAGIRTSTSLDFQKMRDSFAYITPISKILNKDLAQTGALIGVLADNGIKAESAGRLLATAQLKLATEGKTLEDALNAINKAYQEGKRDIELAAVASQYFDSQSVKLGITLASQQDRLKEYEDRIRGSGGALDDLVNEQLKSVDAQLKITASTWETFVLSIENGEGAISNALKTVLGFINDVLKGLTLMNKTQEELSLGLQGKAFEEAKKGYKELGEEADAYAEINRRNAQRNIENLQKEKEANEKILESYKHLNSFQKLLRGDARRAESAIERINQQLSTQIGVLAAANWQLNKNSDATDENTDATNINSNAVSNNTNKRKKSIEALKGSIAWLKNVVSTLEDEQSKLATNSREWTTYKSKIDEAKQAVKDFEIALNGVNEGMKQSGDFDSAADKLLKELEKKPNPLEGFDYDKANEQLNEFAKNHKDKQQKIYEIEKEFASKREELERGLAEASISVVNNLFDAKVQRYEDEINKNNEHYAALLDSEELTLEQRSAIEAERDKKNLELEKKKREEQKKAAIFNKAIAVGQIAIKTAETIAAINLAAAELNAISFGVAGTAFAAVQIPMAIALGAAQTAAVLSVPIPQYAEGKGEYDKYEGPAIWGEKKREVKISKDGNIEISPRKIGNHLTHVKKDDVIHPDANKFLSSLTDEQLYNDIHKFSILASLSSQTESLRVKKSIDNQTDRLIKEMKQNKPKVVIYNNNTNTLSDDISFMLRKQNTL